MSGSWGAWLPWSAEGSNDVIPSFVAPDDMCQVKLRGGTLHYGQVEDFAWDDKPAVVERIDAFRMRPMHSCYMSFPCGRGEEEGDVCNRDGCGGTIEFSPRACHCATGHPPCGNCVEHGLTCPECGWRQGYGRRQDGFRIKKPKAKPDQFAGMRDNPLFGLF